jgi:hypothetical protein
LLRGKDIQEEFSQYICNKVYSVYNQYSQENDLEAIESDGKNNEPLPIDKIRKCLTDMAKNFANKKELEYGKIKVFSEYLEQYSNEDWKLFIDQTTAKNSTDNTKITYGALLALVIPERTYPWLSEVINSIPLPRRFKFIQNWFRQNWSQEIGILFQREIWYASRNYPDARHSLMRTVYKGISDLLIQEIIQSNIQEDYKQRLKKISFLLTEPEWSGIFKDYTDSVWQELNSPEPKPTSKFSIILYQALEESKRLNLNYLNIAKLCKIIGQKYLSALLYRLCGEHHQEGFSEDVWNAVDVLYDRHNSTANSTGKSLSTTSNTNSHSGNNILIKIKERFQTNNYGVIILLMILLFIIIVVSILLYFEHVNNSWHHNDDQRKINTIQGVKQYEKGRKK